MMKHVRTALLALAALGLAGWLAVEFGDFRVRRLEARVDELEREKQRLVDFVRRLSASRRVAQLDILDQSADASGRVVTRSRFQQVGGAGVLGEPSEIETLGSQLYVEALILKFDHALVGAGDEQRGESLALFRRAFGDQQAPESGPSLERTSPPTTDEKPAMQAEHARLWARFWEMADDPKAAAQYGVRVAQLEAPSARVRPGQRWEVSVDAAGGVNLRRLDVH